MERVTERPTAEDRRARDGGGSDVEWPHCLRCGFQVHDLPRGCRGGHCSNCGFPYPLGDCSD